MKFVLSKELIDQIIFAMEDQNAVYVYNIQHETIQSCTDLEFDAIDYSNEDVFCRLPDWDTADGFQLMEAFVQKTKNPPAKEELRHVLLSGKKVFRNFKNVLTKYPEMERKWFSFKDTEMKKKIVQWYNVLAEQWGGEKLGFEPEETEDLVHDDFIFELVPSNCQGLLEISKKAVKEIKLDFQDARGVLFAALCEAINMPVTSSKINFVTKTIQNEYAGFICACSYPLESLQTAIIDGLYVQKQFRGLGLGKELLRLCLEELVKKGYQFAVIAGMIFPHPFKAVLERSGFLQEGTYYCIDLSKFYHEGEG